MTDQAKEARRKYMREWQRSNPEKRKAAIERYWEKKAQQAISTVAKRSIKATSETSCH